MADQVRLRRCLLAVAIAFPLVGGTSLTPQFIVLHVLLVLGMSTVTMVGYKHVICCIVLVDPRVVERPWGPVDDGLITLWMTNGLLGKRWKRWIDEVGSQTRRGFIAPEVIEL